MTTTVKIDAHCDSTKEVKVSIASKHTGENFTLQDGETAERVVYDDIELSVREVVK